MTMTTAMLDGDSLENAAPAPSHTVRTAEEGGREGEREEGRKAGREGGREGGRDRETEIQRQRQRFARARPRPSLLRPPHATHHCNNPSWAPHFSVLSPSLFQARHLFSAPSASILAPSPQLPLPLAWVSRVHDVHLGCSKGPDAAKLGEVKAVAHKGSPLNSIYDTTPPVPCP